MFQGRTAHSLVSVFFRERSPCVCRGKLDSAETERPRAITVDLSEAFWTPVLLLTKPSDSSPPRVVAGSSPLVLWGRRFLATLPMTALETLKAGRALGCLERRSPYYQALFFRGPGARLRTLKSMGRHRPRCQGPQWVRIRTVKPGGAPCAVSWEWRTEREATVHLQDPASWAEFPAPLQAGRPGE